jgi:F-type H+-transporting ATPase subunit epsilon
MATFHFDLVSPENSCFRRSRAGRRSGTEGDFGVLAGHAPVVSIIRPASSRCARTAASRRSWCFGGFAEVSAKGLTVLADVAVAAEDIDQATLAAHIKQVEQKIEKMEQGSELDKEIHRLDHFRTVQQNLTGTAMH